MGASASAPLGGSLDYASSDELVQCAAGLKPEQREKLLKALQAATVTAAVLAKQDSETSQAILTAYAGDAGFQSISDRLTKEIMARDKEDGEKLGNGIQKAVDKGVLPAKVDVEPTTKVLVSGKTADAVSDEIISAVERLHPGPARLIRHGKRHHSSQAEGEVTQSTDLEQREYFPFDNAPCCHLVGERG